jgi:hypothetical protein
MLLLWFTEVEVLDVCHSMTWWIWGITGGGGIWWTWRTKYDWKSSCWWPWWWYQWRWWRWWWWWWWWLIDEVSQMEMNMLVCSNSLGGIQAVVHSKTKWKNMVPFAAKWWWCLCWGHPLDTIDELQVVIIELLFSSDQSSNCSKVK